MTYVRMADAAYAVNIPPGFDIAGGYYGGPAAFHVWNPADWQRFPGWRLPIWVDLGIAAVNGVLAGREAVKALKALGVPVGSITVLDRETLSGEQEAAFVVKFGEILAAAGYRVWVYGSASSIFTNPPLNGYWVADYTSDMREVDRLLQVPHVRAVQFDPAGPYDGSLVKAWTEGEMWRG